MMVRGIFAVLCLGAATVTTASAFDVNDLAPCRPAARRYCDHSDLTPTMNNLLRCGATLASVSSRVGKRCRVVLQRYGQL